MPVSSYLIFCKTPHKENLANTLAGHPSCTVLPALNESLLVLTTDTPSERAEEELVEEIAAWEGVECLSQVFGHSEAALQQGQVN